MKLKETKISAFLENCLSYFKKIRFLILDWCLSIRVVPATQGTFTDVGIGEGGGAFLVFLLTEGKDGPDI